VLVLTGYRMTFAECAQLHRRTDHGTFQSRLKTSDDSAPQVEMYPVRPRRNQSHIVTTVKARVCVLRPRHSGLASQLLSESAMRTLRKPWPPRHLLIMTSKIYIFPTLAPSSRRTCKIFSTYKIRKLRSLCKFAREVWTSRALSV